jgi:membrane-associated phospholipid phosphatase
MVECKNGLIGRVSVLNDSRFYWARLISDLVSPPVVWGVMMFPIAFREADSREIAILWALTYGVLVCLLPVLYIAWMVRRGSISDIHMRLREERLRPFLVSMFCTGLAWGALRLMGAPSVVPLVAIVTLAQLAAMAAITLVWQISIHAMSITSAVVATGLLFGVGPALVVFPLVPLVGAARLKLNRHTPAQVVAGTLVGALVTVALYISVV